MRRIPAPVPGIEANGGCHARYHHPLMTACSAVGAFRFAWAVLILLA
jgi:hypothetical protein